MAKAKKIKTRTYQINVMITSQQCPSVGEDWCFDVEIPRDQKTIRLHGEPHDNIPYAIVTIAKDGG